MVETDISGKYPKSPPPSINYENLGPMDPQLSCWGPYILENTQSLIIPLLVMETFTKKLPNIFPSLQWISNKGS